jgi:hypothetical protein
MAPSAVTNGHMVNSCQSKKPPRKPYEGVHFDPSLKPKNYQIKGTNPNSKVLFLDVNILDGTGADPYKGDVYCTGMSMYRRSQ